jgi:hypothetical protein
MKKLALLPQDGAEFYGRVQTIEPDKEDGHRRFRASCYAQLDLASATQTELPKFGLFDAEKEARTWINSQASARGFSKVRME